MIQQVTYDDTAPWPQRADGIGSSLEVIDPQGDYAQADNWQASSTFGGSPGLAPTAALREVVINEILANSDAPSVDQIELLNTSDQPVDVRHWYLSDSSDDLLKFRRQIGSLAARVGWREHGGCAPCDKLKQNQT